MMKIGLVDSGYNGARKGITIQNGVCVESEEFKKDYMNHGNVIGDIISYFYANMIEIYSVKIFDNNGESSFENILSALRWCIDNNMQIVNMSVGIEDLDEEEISRIDALCKEAYDKNIVIVAADKVNSVVYPAASSYVISVDVDETFKVGEWLFETNQMKIYTTGLWEIPDQSFCSYSRPLCSNFGSSISCAYVTCLFIKRYKENVSIEKLYNCVKLFTKSFLYGKTNKSNNRIKVVYPVTKSSYVLFDKSNDYNVYPVYLNHYLYDKKIDDLFPYITPRPNCESIVGIKNVIQCHYEVIDFLMDLREYEYEENDTIQYTNHFQLIDILCALMLEYDQKFTITLIEEVSLKKSIHLLQFYFKYDVEFVIPNYEAEINRDSVLARINSKYSTAIIPTYVSNDVMLLMLRLSSCNNKLLFNYNPYSFLFDSDSDDNLNKCSIVNIERNIVPLSNATTDEVILSIKTLKQFAQLKAKNVLLLVKYPDSIEHIQNMINSINIYSNSIIKGIIISHGLHESGFGYEPISDNELEHYRNVISQAFEYPVLKFSETERQKELIDYED